MKTDKKALLAYAEQNRWEYPKMRVSLGFSLCGSYIGGMIFCFIYSIYYHKFSIADDNLIMDFLFVHLMFGFVGIIFGFIPAFFTASILNEKAYTIRKNIDYFKLFYIGCGVSGIFLIIIFPIFFLTKNTILFVINYVVTGGLSSMICGKLFLPKLPKNF